MQSELWRGDLKQVQGGVIGKEVCVYGVACKHIQTDARL